MIQAVRNFLQGVEIWPYAITALVAITGAIVALIGAFLGSHEIMEFGRSAAGFGAVGFFGWLLFTIALRSA